MSDDILRADTGLRRLTFIALGVALMAAIAAVFLFQQWLNGIATVPGTDLLIMRLRRLIGLALTGSAICLALLAWYSAHKASKVRLIQQWPLPGVRVIRDTPIRRGAAALSIGRRLNLATGVLILLAVITGLISWRLLSLS